MPEFSVLKIIDLFSFFYRVMGVNYAVMRQILQIKLLMDRRRVPAVLASSGHKNEANAFNKSLLTYGFIGIIFVIFIFLPLPLFIKMNLTMGMIIFMVAMTMVAEFSTVLLDTKDKTILLSKPIDSRTVNAAKMTHIIINLLTIIVVMAGPSLVVGLFVHGFLFFVLLFGELLLVSGFILFLTSFFYFFMLLFFDGDRLRDVINYFQVVFSLVMMVGYQFIGRIYSFVDYDFVFVIKWWMYLLPSAWFAAPFSLVLESKVDDHLVYLSLLGLLVPVLLWVLYFKFATGYFEKNLYKLDRAATRKRKTLESKALKYKKLYSYIMPDTSENIFCRFAQNMISSERSLKLRLFPNLGLAAFLPLIMLINLLVGTDSVHQSLSYISHGPFYLSIYITVFILSASITTMNSSEMYKGAWIYKALPIESPGVILRGALTGFVLKYLIPIYLFVCLLFTPLYGISLVPHILLIFLNMLLLIILIFRMSPKELPFSKGMQSGRSVSLGIFLGSLVFCSITAGLHYTLQDFYIGLIIYIIVVFLVTATLWKASAKITWKDVV
ncbi:MAG: hypothetical protein JL56_17265 [Desulfotomaculum sp. BICA1-6]|nr:MAG: hypothetical protein JL56_17265 [Desulfotomaculum sp. BICA1-6]